MYTTQAELLRFFCMQQKAANCSQQANEMKQCQVNRTHGYRHSDHKSEAKADTMLQVLKSKEVKKSTGCISANTKCPIHPQASHTWGECYSNAANKNKPKTNSDKVKKRPGKLKREEIDSNAAHLDNNYVSTTSTVTSHGADDDITVSTINDGMSAQLCLDLNEKIDDPATLVAKFKAACAESSLL
jgi:hypothetical protein